MRRIVQYLLQICKNSCSDPRFYNSEICNLGCFTDNGSGSKRFQGFEWSENAPLLTLHFPYQTLWHPKTFEHWNQNTLQIPVWFFCRKFGKTLMIFLSKKKIRKISASCDFWPKYPGNTYFYLVSQYIYLLNYYCHNDAGLVVSQMLGITLLSFLGKNGKLSFFCYFGKIIMKTVNSS